MNISPDPNVGYLLLAATLLLASMAIATPGTGVLEIGAFIGMVLVGWAVLSLEVNAWAVGLILLVALPLFALRKTGRSVFLVIAILLLEIGSAFLFRGEGWLPAVNPLLAIFVTLLTATYYWITTQKLLEAEKAPPVHDIRKLIGALGEARTPIAAEGTIYAEGELWSARSNQPIPDGATVRITGREGFILLVEQVE